MIRSEKKPGPASRPALYWLFWVGIIFLYIAFRINLIDIPLGRDEGGYAYMGRLLLDGGLPYIDAVNHKPPLIFFIYSVALSIFPNTTSGIHIFLHIYNFLTLLCVYFLAVRVFRSKEAGLFAALSYGILSIAHSILGSTGSSELFMMLPVAISLLLVLKAEGMGRQANLFYLLSGFSGAAACWIKPPAATSILFVAIYIVVSTILSGRREGRLRLATLKPFLSFCIGLLTLSALLVAYFVNAGAGEEFFYWNFTHNFLYGGAADPSFVFKNLSLILGDFFRENPLIITAGIAGIIAPFLKGEKKAGLIVAGFLLFSFAGIVPGYAYAHYLAQLAVPLALGAGGGLLFFSRIVRTTNARSALTAAMVIIIIGVPLARKGPYYFESPMEEKSKYVFHYDPFLSAETVSEYIKEKTGVDEKILILGSEPEILFLSERKSAMPFIFTYPLVRDYPRADEFRTMAWKKIKEARPAKIVFVNVTGSWVGRPDKFLSGQGAAFMREGYELEAIVLVDGDGVAGQIVSTVGMGEDRIQSLYEKTQYLIYGRKAFRP